MLGCSPDVRAVRPIVKPPLGEYTSNRRDGEMAIFGKVATLVSYLLSRRRRQWVEISLERAWDREAPPRLFDLGKP